MRAFIFIALSFAIVSLSHAQKPVNVLFTVGDEVVTDDEFVYIYEKNNKNEEDFYSEQNVRDYLNLYINFKLKVKAAEEKGIDTTEAFVSEFNTYRNQLTKPYFTDQETLEDLKKEAYERMKYEIRASHILIRLSEDATEDQVKEAENKINEIYKKAISENGESFNEIALEYSEDPSVKQNNGDLGYFTVFNLIYPFETHAYNTPVGEVSKPFRTRFGYHILKVTDKKKYKGKINISQIYVPLKATDNDKQKQQAKARIDSIYKMLQDGANFDNLINRYSDNKQTATSGNLPEFSYATFGVPEEFKKVAFSLQKDGDYSEPFMTSAGWHIFKRNSLNELKSYDELEKFIEIKVKKDTRSKLSEENLIRKLKAKYRFKEKTKSLKVLYKNVDSSFLKKQWKIQNPDDYGKFLFRIEKDNYTVLDYAKFLEANQRANRFSNIQYAIDYFYNEFVVSKLKEYADKNLENEYPEFRHLVKEYKEGMMLFEIMDEQVWSKAMADSAALRNFYENHKEEYMWKERVDAVIFMCHNEEIAKEVKKMVVDYNRSADQIASELNEKNPLNISYSKSIYEKGENKIIDAHFGEKGAVMVYDEENEVWKVLNLLEYYDAQYKKFEEIRGIVIAEFQNYLDKEWIEHLKVKYPVKINEDVLQAVINR